MSVMGEDYLLIKGRSKDHLNLFSLMLDGDGFIFSFCTSSSSVPTPPTFVLSSWLSGCADIVSTGDVTCVRKRSRAQLNLN